MPLLGSCLQNIGRAEGPAAPAPPVLLESDGAFLIFLSQRSGLWALPCPSERVTWRGEVSRGLLEATWTRPSPVAWVACQCVRGVQSPKPGPLWAHPLPRLLQLSLLSLRPPCVGREGVERIILAETSRPAWWLQRRLLTCWVVWARSRPAPLDLKGHFQSFLSVTWAVCASCIP